MGADTDIDPLDLELAPPAWVTRLEPGSFHETPDGVDVRSTLLGHGLFATRPTKAGDTLFSRTPHFIADDDEQTPVTIRLDGDITPIDIDRSLSVRLGTYRHVSMPDYIFNHSCDPNTHTRVRADGISFDQVALRDIEPGDELTCAYVVFDWDCDGHSFACECGSEQCYGEIRGFAGLPDDVKQRVAERAHPWVLLQWERARARAAT